MAAIPDIPFARNLHDIGLVWYPYRRVAIASVK
jgi:hypothetical protein